MGEVDMPAAAAALLPGLADGRRIAEAPGAFRSQAHVFEVPLAKSWMSRRAKPAQRERTKRRSSNCPSMAYKYPFEH